ncbi:hypothetical protein C815_01363 [Firmicutes bacterium M10-2]|nr:hypothetical protein C815_01363 [Firmicutes bacterium M10-2]
MDIVFNQVGKKYDKDIVLDRLDLRFPVQGGIVSFLGPNGIGKTTIMKLLSGILLPTSGTIATTEGKGKDYDAWARQNVAYCSSDDRYLSYKLTGIENIVRYGVLKGVDKAQVLTWLESFASCLDSTTFLNKRVEQMSTGQKKMTKVLSCFASGYPVLILDEPTNGLDEESRSRLIETIGRMKEKAACSLFVSSHDLGFIHQITDTHLFLFGNDKAELKTMPNATLDALQAAYHTIKGGNSL